jgi:Uma2 family endonuclease
VPVMSAVAKPVTLEAFLDWESRQELKYEFDGFQPVAMTGRTAARARIQFNLLGLLFNGLRGHRCQGYGSELKIQVAGRIRYRDAFIVRSPVLPGALVVHDPVVVFEILSPRTFDTDHFERNLEYRDTPSIQRYVMLEQSCRGATVFSRKADEWVGHVLTGDDDLALPEVEITLRLADLYEGVIFPAAPEEALTASD